MITPAHLAALGLTLVVGLGVGVALERAMPRAKQPPVIVHAASVATPRQLEHRAQVQWPELEQAAVDRLTAALVKVTARERVEILCADRSECGDLALDFENAFESAHWANVAILPPALGVETVGLTSNSPGLAQAVDAATGLAVNVVARDPRDPLVLLIGRKPR